MAVFLEIVDGPQSGRRVEIPDAGTLLVGRGSNSQLEILGDDAMSSVHFLIRAEQDTCTITDQQSTNGTSVNNIRVETTRLQPGDRIQAGRTEFVLQSSATPELLPQ